MLGISHLVMGCQSKKIETLAALLQKSKNMVGVMLLL
jgi:hypothetical protein